MFIISAKSGQLGNRLLIFANFIAFALENNITVLNPAFADYADFFQGTARDVFCCYPPLMFAIAGNKFTRKQYYNLVKFLIKKRIFKVKQITRKEPFNWSKSETIKDLKQKQCVYCFQGWLFRDGWFVEDTPKLYKYASEIRAYFSPLETYKIKVNCLMMDLRKNADIIIGVHIRQGDYEQHQKGRYFYTTEQYIQVMNAVKHLFAGQSIKFLICSNVPQNTLLFENFNKSFGNHHLIEDLYALAECDYILGPPSSYTRWASFYGDKPLYMIRNIEQEITLKEFVNFYGWRGVFHYRDDWNESFWEWKNQSKQTA